MYHLEFAYSPIQKYLKSEICLVQMFQIRDIQPAYNVFRRLCQVLSGFLLGFLSGFLSLFVSDTQRPTQEPFPIQNIWYTVTVSFYNKRISLRIWTETRAWSWKQLEPGNVTQIGMGMWRNRARVPLGLNTHLLPKALLLGSWLTSSVVTPKHIFENPATCAPLQCWLHPNVPPGKTKVLLKKQTHTNFHSRGKD